MAFARVDTVTVNQNFKIVSDYALEEYEGTHALALYITMVNYPVEQVGSHPTLLANFNLVITPAVCDCKLLNWIMPTAQTLTTTVLKATSDTITIAHATVDPASKTTTPAIRACYRTDPGPAPGCNEATAITAVVEEANDTQPVFMTLAGSVLTVTPTLSSQAKSYTMKVTHDT